MGGRGTARRPARGKRGHREAATESAAPPRERSARATALGARVAELPAARWLAARPTLSAALLLALPVLILLWPALVGGAMLSPLAVLYGQIPWVGTAPPDLPGYLNPLLSDIAQAHHPWNAFARGLLHEGTFPAWNPHVLAGVPFFPNPQTVLLSPFSLPLWVLPLNYGVGVSAALKLWAAGFGTYLLVRELKLGFLPGLLAALAYMLCSFNVTWLTHESLPGVAAVLPWMLWLAERTLRRGGLGAPIGLAAVTAIAITGGHPGTQLHVLAATALYAAVRVALLPDLARAARARRLALAGGGIAAGILLAAVLFLPELLSSRDTLGTVARAEGGQPGSEMPLEALRSVLFPDWWGRPSGLEAANQPIAAERGSAFTVANFNERTFFAGVVSLLLACVALVTPGGWRRKAPFAALGALALAVVLRLPGLHQLVEQLPGFGVIQNQRAHFVFELAVALLAAFGLHALLTRPAADARRRLGVAAGALAVGLAAAAASGADGSAFGDVIEHFATGADVTSEAALRLTTVTWFLLLAGAVAAALLALWRRPQAAVAIGVALVALGAFDMLRFANGYQPMAPAAKVIPPRTPAIAYLQEHEGAGRFLGIGNALPPDWSLMYGLHDVRGYDPPFPTLRYYDLWRIANPGQTNWQSFTMDGLGDDALRVASVLGARLVIGPPGLDAAGGGGELRAVRRVYAGDDATIFENALAAPRVLVPARVEVADDVPGTRAAVVAEGFDPRRTAVVERGEAGADAGALEAGSAESGAPGTARIAGEENAEVRIEADMERRGLVALNDSMIDGWSVTVDGEPASAVHVNTVMRGVVVDAGRHEIVWSYSVPGLKAGLVVSLLTALALAGGVVALVVRRRRSGAPEGLESPAER